MFASRHFAALFDRQDSEALRRVVESKIEKLNEDLATLLRAKFEEQLTRYERQLLEVVAPYERFLETERTKLESGLDELRNAEREVAALEQRVVETFPEGR